MVSALYLVYILQVIVHIHITYILDKRRKQKVEEYNIYSDIAQRSQGDVYIGVVGPVRTGKSTFIKKFMDLLVIPNIENVFLVERTRVEF